MPNEPNVEAVRIAIREALASFSPEQLGHLEKLRDFFAANIWASVDVAQPQVARALNVDDDTALAGVYWALKMASARMLVMCAGVLCDTPAQLLSEVRDDYKKHRLVLRAVPEVVEPDIDE